MKNKNVAWIIAIALVAAIVVASLAVAIGAGVIVLFSDGGEGTTAAQSEQTQESVESTADGSETQSGSDASESNPYGTTEVFDAFTNTEAVTGVEITENDD